MVEGDALAAVHVHVDVHVDVHVHVQVEGDPLPAVYDVRVCVVCDPNPSPNQHLRG